MGRRSSSSHIYLHHPRCLCFWAGCDVSIRGGRDVSVWGAVRANRLAELARLPFLPTAQEYTEHFNALLYYTSNLAPAQKAELFMLAHDLPAQVSSKLTYTHTNSHSCRMKKG